MTVQQDPVTDRLREAIELGRRGERVVARQRFDELWAEIRVQGDPMDRSAVAHHAADVQDDLIDELCWRRRALDAAHEVTDDRVRAHQASVVVARFYPTGYLKLADVHRRLDDAAGASRHLEQARAAADALEASGHADIYDRLIGDEIDHCATRIAEQVRGDAAGG